MEARIYLSAAQLRLAIEALAHLRDYADMSRELADSAGDRDGTLNFCRQQVVACERLGEKLNEHLEQLARHERAAF